MSNGGWAKDPSGKHEHRYHVDGAWTDDVSDAGVVSKDPVAGAEAPDQSTASRPTPGPASAHRHPPSRARLPLLRVDGDLAG